MAQIIDITQFQCRDWNFSKRFKFWLQSKYECIYIYIYTHIYIYIYHVQSDVLKDKFHVFSFLRPRVGLNKQKIIRNITITKVFYSLRNITIRKFFNFLTTRLTIPKSVKKGETVLTLRGYEIILYVLFACVLWFIQYCFISVLSLFSVFSVFWVLLKTL